MLRKLISIKLEAKEKSIELGKEGYSLKEISQKFGVSNRGHRLMVNCFSPKEDFQVQVLVPPPFRKGQIRLPARRRVSD